MSDQAERLFEQALALESVNRRDFVDNACRENPQLSQELHSLLAEAEEADEFFGRLGDAVFSNDSSNNTEDLFANTEVEELHEGDAIGHYRIVSFIGSGGMGTVYRAHDTRLDREVALKFLPSYLGADEEAQKRLLVEARAVAALDHPNVCSIHEIGETTDGRLFIAMPYYDGETLKEKLRREQLSVKESVAIAIQIARGLSAAHARGIIHRDVKPGNIIAGSDGSIRLLDFGLAIPVDSNAISSGMTPGTVAYMSPEQARGRTLDPRTDLWSLGVVLYEMLVRERPFRGAKAQDILHSILHKQPASIRERDREISEDVARIVDKLLQKDPVKRYSNAGAVLKDLEHSVSPRATSRKSVVAVSALFFVMLLGVLSWRRMQVESADAAAARTARPSIAVLPLENLGSDSSDAALATGLSEELISILATTGNIRVIAGTPVSRFKPSSIDVRKIADSLGVSNILEGGLQKAGARLRLQVRLINGRDGATLWSQSYDREFNEMLQVQDEIARAVASELNLRFASDRQFFRRHPRSMVAYELYVRASDPVLTRSQSGIWKAQKLFEDAITADPEYAASYAGLALVHLRRARFANDPGMPAADVLKLAEAEARKAIDLDSALADGHNALGRVLEATLDFRSAEKAIRKAIALDPSRSVYRKALLSLIAWKEEPEEELAEARREIETDPLDPYSITSFASGLYDNRRYDDALQQLQRLSAVKPPLLIATFIAAQCYAKKQMLPEAIATLRPGAEGGDPLLTALLGHTLALAGQRVEANRIMNTLKDRLERTGTGAFQVAVVYAGLGDKDETFAWLNKSIDDRTITNFIMSPMFDDLRGDARFEMLRKRLGLQKHAS